MNIERIELIGGHPALDFVNSVEGRGSETLLNYLPDFEALARWCGRVGLLPAAALRQALRDAKAHPRAAVRTWREAMALREALNRVFRALATGTSPPDQATAQVNKAVHLALARRELVRNGANALQWSWDARSTALDLPLLELALAAAALLTDAASEGRVKVCANGPCDWMFFDSSRSGRRRWCRMAVCGNATKVRNFRERQRRKR